MRIQRAHASQGCPLCVHCTATPTTCHMDMSHEHGRTRHVGVPSTEPRARIRLYRNGHTTYHSTAQATYGPEPHSPVRLLRVRTRVKSSRVGRPRTPTPTPARTRPPPPTHVKSISSQVKRPRSSHVKSCRAPTARRAAFPRAVHSDGGAVDGGAGTDTWCARSPILASPRLASPRLASPRLHSTALHSTALHSTGLGWT